ncbi:precorrin-2 C(20)-methyltransferase [Pseudoroseomonas cervicalis]|uniref:Precorrin-2 C(20)-methyltransferase n=1 Tax=Pseudoroseomonas cervicalis ATCC 49957 TaxID=525371 RepID=D5RL31_9PROT|nr:precorrin-2 C(20)-methyltransferase [Pseudoroseomonas cervicalis]EFH11969.1 precorrin-2 C(20)-methyltransferase [Pseudoroseomonas cervicalis ATCC 49957]
MSGVLHIVGVGPGDPELVTLRAARILGRAPSYAFFAKRGRVGHAVTIATPHLNPAAEALRFEYPYTTELSVEDARYAGGMGAFYDDCAERLAGRLSAGEEVALLCEGDPFLYGSAMYLFDRLRGRFAVEVTPGITAMSGCWSRAAAPMVHGDDVLSVLPATMPEAELAEALQRCDAAVVMKLGRNLPKLRAVLERTGLLPRAIYAERGTMPGEVVMKLAERDDSPAPYFALVLIPGRQGVR